LIPYHLARNLAERHHHVDLIAFYARPEDVADIPRYERFFRHIRLIREPGRGPLQYLLRLNFGSFFPTTARAAWSAPMWSAIQETLSLAEYDVVQLFGGIHVYEYREIVRNRPNLIVPYESYTLYLDNERKARRPGQWLRAWYQNQQHFIAQEYERRMFTGFDRVVVLTENDANALRNLRSDLRIQVIPNGVDTDYFVSTGMEPNEPTLVFSGNFEYEPNVGAALRLAKHIFPAVKQRVPRAKLLLVGANPPPALTSFQGKDIEITGRVPDVRPYLERGLIFVCPLEYGAGIKNKVLEAMAMYKPIVATSLSMDGIMAQDGRHFLLAESNEEIMRAVVRLVKEGPLRKSMARAGRALIEERYTWRRVAERYEDLYREISWHRVGRS
jgi:glycosyltransferase involved in cell wall biosynthesis